jgi:hypothetical protein
VANDDLEGTFSRTRFLAANHSFRRQELGGRRRAALAGRESEVEERSSALFDANRYAGSAAFDERESAFPL